MIPQQNKRCLVLTRVLGAVHKLCPPLSAAEDVFKRCQHMTTDVFFLVLYLNLKKSELDFQKYIPCAMQ